MTSSVEQMLIDMRADRIRASKARIPTTRPPIPKGLELKYSVQLRNYQRAINKELLAVLEPLIATYRQDATTEEIEDTTDRASKAVTTAIVFGAILSTIIRGQGNALAIWNDKKYSAPIYQMAGLNNISSEQARKMLESWTVENVSLIKGINDEQIKKLETLLLRANREFLKPGAITEQIADIMQSSVKRATLIARDQTLKLNGQIDHVKQIQAGITHFIWRTSRDERVRAKHRALEGKKFAWDNPPSEGLPGQPIQCRCSAEPSLEELLGPDFAAEGPQSIKAPRPKKRRRK